MMNSSLALVLSRGLNSVFNIIGFFIISKTLNLEDLGSLVFSLSLAGLLGIFVNLGLGDVLMNSLSIAKFKIGSILGSAIVLKIVGFILCILIIYIINLSENPTYQFVNIIIGLSLLVEIFIAYESYFYFQKKSSVIVIANIASGFVGLLLKSVVVYCFMSIWMLALTYLLESIIKSGVLYFNARTISLKIDSNYLKENLPKIGHVVLSGASMVVIFKIDQLMIRYLLTKPELAVYSVAVKITEIWIFICIALSNYKFESILKSYKYSFELFECQIINLYKTVILISLIIISLIFIGSSAFVNLIFGDKFSESIPILYIYIISLPFMFINNASWKYFIPLNIQKFASIKLLVGAVINIILNFTLIPLLGLKGAAIATVITMVYVSIFGNLLFTKTKRNFSLILKSI